VEGLKGKSGYLTISRLAIGSFETEECLQISAADDEGRSIDHRTCTKLFNVESTVAEIVIPVKAAVRLVAEANQLVRATNNRSLEANSQHFNVARERLEQWAEDKIIAAKKAMKDIKEQIKTLCRQARQAETPQEQHEVQERLIKLERHQRQQIFTVEDEIEEKRDELIAELEKRLSQHQQSERLFTIRWSII